MGGLGSRITARPELRERLTGEYARAVRLGDVCNVRRDDMADVLEILGDGVRAEEALRQIKPLLDAQFDGHADRAEYLEKVRKLNEAYDIVLAAVPEEKQG